MKHKKSHKIRPVNPPDSDNVEDVLCVSPDSGLRTAGIGFEKSLGDTTYVENQTEIVQRFTNSKSCFGMQAASSSSFVPLPDAL